MKAYLLKSDNEDRSRIWEEFRILAIKRGLSVKDALWEAIEEYVKGKEKDV